MSIEDVISAGAAVDWKASMEYVLSTMRHLGYKVPDNAPDTPGPWPPEEMATFARSLQQLLASRQCDTITNDQLRDQVDETRVKFKAELTKNATLNREVERLLAQVKALEGELLKQRAKYDEDSIKQREKAASQERRLKEEQKRVSEVEREYKRMEVENRRLAQSAARGGGSATAAAYNRFKDDPEVLAQQVQALTQQMHELGQQNKQLQSRVRSLTEVQGAGRSTDATVSLQAAKQSMAAENRRQTDEDGNNATKVENAQLRKKVRDLEQNYLRLHEASTKHETERRELHHKLAELRRETAHLKQQLEQEGQWRERAKHLQASLVEADGHKEEQRQLEASLAGMQKELADQRVRHAQLEVQLADQVLLTSKAHTHCDMMDKALRRSQPKTYDEIINTARERVEGLYAELSQKQQQLDEARRQQQELIVPTNTIILQMPPTSERAKPALAASPSFIPSNTYTDVTVGEGMPLLSPTRPEQTVGLDFAFPDMQAGCAQPSADTCTCSPAFTLPGNALGSPSRLYNRGFASTMPAHPPSFGGAQMMPTPPSQAMLAMGFGAVSAATAGADEAGSRRSVSADPRHMHSPSMWAQPVTGESSAGELGGGSAPRRRWDIPAEGDPRREPSPKITIREYNHAKSTSRISRSPPAVNAP